MPSYICISVLDKQRMAYKLEKFGVGAECILIKSNKAVGLSTGFPSTFIFTFLYWMCCKMCFPLWQWSVDLINAFMEFMEMFVAVLPSHIYQTYSSPEIPLPVLSSPCPLRYRPSYYACFPEPLAPPPLTIFCACLVECSYNDSTTSLLKWEQEVFHVRIRQSRINGARMGLFAASDIPKTSM